MIAPVACDIVSSRRAAENDEITRSSLDRPVLKRTYPGSDSAFSSVVFLSLYDEEELSEIEDLSWADTCKLVEGVIPDLSEASNRPSIYHVLRLFDSIRGFHKGYLDLSGRHCERYYTLFQQWNCFLFDFLQLQHEEVLSWRHFRQRWRLPHTISHSQLFKCTQKVLKDLKQRPVPVFQRLFFKDLPVEILDSIISLVTVSQAKTLSCTCRAVNDICQRYIFRTWRMTFRVQSYTCPFNVEYARPNLAMIAQHARRDLLNNAGFISMTPRVSKHIRKLVLSDEWWVNRRLHSRDNNPFALPMDFYKPISQALGSVLRHIPKLSTLVLCNLELNMELIRRIAKIPALHTLDLHLCRIPRTAIRKLTTDRAFICSQISNLRVYMDSSFQETYSQWHTLLLCPYIRTLSVIQYGIDPFPSPDNTFWEKCRLEHLERLSLDNVDAIDLAELAKWFSNDKASSALLTHFKLHMDWGIFDAEIIPVLRSLSSAPLEVLALEGLAEAEFILFKEISKFFPDLVALTMVRRQNSSQHQDKLASWPHASWEYAKPFSGFRKLQHFCWNYLTEYWDATPAMMVAFETGFRAGCSTSTSELASPHACGIPTQNTYTTSPADEIPYFLDSHWMALPFAAYCPTLKSFALMDRAMDMVCRVTRDHNKGGAIALTPRYSNCSNHSLTWSEAPGYIPGLGLGLSSGGTSGMAGWSSNPGIESSGSVLATNVPVPAGAPGPVQAYDELWGVQQWNTVGSHWPILAPLGGKTRRTRG